MMLLLIFLCSSFIVNDYILNNLNSERLHILITGTTGTGKTNMLNELLPQIRLHKDRAIIVDTTGAFTDRFFDSKCDKLLNPFEKIVSNGCLGMIVLKQLIFII
ncbi:conjugal transfer protein TraD [Orientia tsutsugamushi]|uniref:Conjugal transfer protein TraD n=1 Tax=Orientia tsutsugamushi TaxID=784 RepID=A0A2U3RAJ8_ORITS|nr:type II/IV secretion system family protein [Orientia tsutsugamushi str. UT76]SPR10168.1 conjugal transfer protein TraD [Orientia tsutsugamushi]